MVETKIKTEWEGLLQSENRRIIVAFSIRISHLNLQELFEMKMSFIDFFFKNK